jgi:hypothetical protein
MFFEKQEFDALLIRLYKLDLSSFKLAQPH